MTAKVVNIELDPGADTIIEYDWTDPSTGLPINLTGYTAKMEVRSKPYDSTVLLSLTTANGKIVLGGVTGTIQLMFSSTDTNTGTWFSGVYDLFIINTGSNITTAVAKGFVTILQQVTS